MNQDTLAGIVRIKEVRNAYFRMDDALDGLDLHNFDQSDAMGQAMQKAWEAHKLLADILEKIDPAWNAPVLPPNFNND